MKRVLLNIARKVKATLRRAKNYLRWLLSFEIYRCDAETAFQRLAQIAPSPGTSALTDNCIGSAEYDLTIIIPAYNSEKWLEECIDSVLTQETALSYQVIAVDDGSSDRTPEILDRYAADVRMHVIHQKNRGHSGARNTALKQIQSRYIMFVDSDDILLPGAIEKLLVEAVSSNADIVEGNGYQFDEQGRIGPVKPAGLKNRLWGVPWMKVIRSDMFAHLEFPMGYLYEDTIISALLAPMAERVVMIPDEVYGYRIHPESITQKHTAEMNRVHSFWIMLQMHEDMKKLGLDKNYDSYCRTMRHIVFTYRRCVLLPDEIKKLIFICTRMFLLEQYGDYLSTEGRYYNLAASLVRYQYGKYCVLCETTN